MTLIDLVLVSLGIVLLRSLVNAHCAAATVRNSEHKRSATTRQSTSYYLILIMRGHIYILYIYVYIYVCINICFSGRWHHFALCLYTVAEYFLLTIHLQVLTSPRFIAKHWCFLQLDFILFTGRVNFCVYLAQFSHFACWINFGGLKIQSSYLCASLSIMTITTMTTKLVYHRATFSLTSCLTMSSILKGVDLV
jgi:hypothetical protein